MADVPMEESQSLDSIIESIQQYGASGVGISPHLSAIQSLNGDNPGEKYKHLNVVVKKIVVENQNIDNAFKFIDESQEIPPAFKHLIKIHVAKELKAHNVILEALLSEDKTIVNQALKATWFFDNTNPILQAENFINNILPHLPDLIRHKIIKILSKTLFGAEENAEQIFNALVSLYSFEEAFPLLPACSQDFIYDEIIKRKLVLSHEMLLILYKRHPSLVIRYLNLGDPKNDSNEEDRKKHKINICVHKKFIPHLIRNDVHNFLKFRSICKCSLPIGKTRTALFFKRAVNEVMNDPKTFLQIWPKKLICKKITIEQFETMFSNLFPEKQTSFQLGDMLDYLRYYPKEKRLDLLSRLYKSKYSVEILNGIYNINQTDLSMTYDLMPLEFFEKLYFKKFPSNVKLFDTQGMLRGLTKYPEEKKLKFFLESFTKRYDVDFFENVENVKCDEFLKLLSSDERKKQATRLIDLCEIKSDEYYSWNMYMPLEDSFSIFKNAISESSSWSTRCQFIKKMIIGCKISRRKGDLLQVLKYYVERHKNERTDFLRDFLGYFGNEFDLKKLNKEIWQILFEIIQIAHVKGDLNQCMFSTLARYFNAVTYFIQIDCKEHSDEVNSNETDEIFLNKVFDVTGDYIVEASLESRISDIYEFSIKRYSLDKLVNLFAMKYPKENQLWQGKKGMIKKFNLAEGILRAFNSYNKECMEKLKKKTDFSNNLKLLKVSDYPWLLKLVTDSMDRDFNNDRKWPQKLLSFKQLLEKVDVDTYNKTNGNAICTKTVADSIDIRSGEAWIKLKKDPNHVLENWNEYFIECRNRLKKNSKFGGAAAKRFLLTLKWYGILPNKFIERSFLEIKEIGSIKIFGVLLESEVFSKVISPLAPQTSSVDIANIESKSFYQMVRSIPQAMNLSNPLTSFDTMLLFCVGDYLKLAIESFTYTSKRILKSKIMVFAESLIKKPVAVKKQGIKLFFKAATKSQLQQFVQKMYSQKSHTSIRELIAELVLDRFKNDPNSDTWNLLEICLKNLSVNDEVPLQIFCAIPCDNEYVPLYLDLLLQKIEILFGNEPRTELRGLEEKYLCLLFEKLRIRATKYLSEEKILTILEKYYFETDSVHIHATVGLFARKIFQNS